MIRVLIADDEELVRTGLRMILQSEPDLEVVGEAVDGQDALSQSASLEPDVLLLDLHMPELDGLGVLRGLAGVGPSVVVLTTFDTDANVQEALLAGAAGFLLKDAPAAQLVAAVRAAASGDAVLSRSVARRVFERLPHQQSVSRSATGEGLTEREQEVLTLIADGCSNAEIAQRLHIVEGTVKTHVARILMKLGVRDRLQAVVAAYRAGLVFPEPPSHL